MLFTSAFTVNRWRLTIGNKTSDKLSERSDRARERGRAQSKMEVKQACGRSSFTLPPEAYSENTHNDVSHVTVMMLSLYARRRLASESRTRNSASRDFILIFGYREIASRSKELARIFLQFLTLIRITKKEAGLRKIIAIAIKIHYCRLTVRKIFLNM